MKNFNGIKEIVSRVCQLGSIVILISIICTIFVIGISDIIQSYEIKNNDFPQKTITLNQEQANAAMVHGVNTIYGLDLATTSTKVYYYAGFIPTYVLVYESEK